jgi:hypothetical protein
MSEVCLGNYQEGQNIAAMMGRDKDAVVYIFAETFIAYL